MKWARFSPTDSEGRSNNSAAQGLTVYFIAAPSDHCAYTYAIYIAEVKRAKQEDDVYIFAAVQGRARRNASRKRLESCPNKMKVTFSWNPKDIGTHS